MPSNCQLDYRTLSQQVRDKYFECKQRYGAVKLQKALEQDGILCSVKRVQRHMAEQGLRSVVVKKYHPHSEKYKVPDKEEIYLHTYKDFKEA